MVARDASSYLVLGFFETRVEANDALLAVAVEADRESRGGRIAMLAPDPRGDPEVVGVEANDRGPLDTVFGAIGSALLGGVLPARDDFFDDGSDLTTDDVLRFSVEIEAGHAAVFALASRARADRLVVLLAGLGGKTEIHGLSRHAGRPRGPSISRGGPRRPA